MPILVYPAIALLTGEFGDIRRNLGLPVLETTILTDDLHRFLLYVET